MRIPASQITPGVHQLEIYGSTQAQYRLHINVTDDERANAAAANVPGVTLSNKHLPISPVVPVSSVPNGNVYRKIPDLDANTIFLPLISR